MSGGSTQTSTTSSGPPPQVLASYEDLVKQANAVSQNPLQQYSGPMVAGFTPQQQQAFQTIQNSQGIGQPYINAAAQQFGTATTPLWPTLPQFNAQNVNQYLNPYTSDVTSALTGLYNNQNQQQQQNIQGNATARGAYGGDREAVAQALTAGQEQLNQAPTLAQVQQQGYQGAQGEFNTQQQQQLAAEQANAWLASQAGFGLAGLGTQAQTSALTGANANLQAGGLQQQLAQEQLNIPYQQFEQTQAYPYQQLSFLAPIVEGTGSLSGGIGSTTTPGPSTLSQLGGLGLTGLGVYGLGQNMGWFGGAGPSSMDVGGGGAVFDDVKRGGRIGYAPGGALPMVPGIGAGVPMVDNSFMPQPVPTGSHSALGLSPFAPVQSETVSGGGGGVAGGIGTAVGLANLASKVIPLLFKRGGRAHYDQGGGIGASGGLPAVPALDLNYITKATQALGNTPHGSGPPHPPNAMPMDDPYKDASQLTGAMGSIGKMIEPHESAARGGSIGHEHRDMGGGMGSIPVSVAAQYGGAPPTVTGQLQQLLQLPLNRLQEMAVQYPPTTQQGRLVQQAIAQKQATPGSGTVPSGGAQQPPQQGAVSGMASGTSALAATPQDFGGTSHAAGMAAGGDTRGYVTPEELDPAPVVDHSGDTVKVRYKSEGKVLDLGLPSIQPEDMHYAAGGAAGAAPSAASGFPHVSLSGGEWTVPTSQGSSGIGHDPITGPAGNAPLAGTATTPGGSPYITSLPTANGVAIPQVSGSMFAAPTGIGAGQGLSGWNSPLQQLTQFGKGPNGTTTFPSSTAFVPGAAGLFSAVGNPVPTWAGGTGMPAPAATMTAAPVSTQPLDDTIFVDSGGSKRGGRAGFDDGGSVDDPALGSSGAGDMLDNQAGPPPRDRLIDMLANQPAPHDRLADLDPGTTLAPPPDALDRVAARVHDLARSGFAARDHGTVGAERGLGMPMGDITTDPGLNLIGGRDAFIGYGAPHGAKERADYDDAGPQYVPTRLPEEPVATDDFRNPGGDGIGGLGLGTVPRESSKIAIPRATDERDFSDVGPTYVPTTIPNGALATYNRPAANFEDAAFTSTPTTIPAYPNRIDRARALADPDYRKALIPDVTLPTAPPPHGATPERMPVFDPTLAVQAGSALGHAAGQVGEAVTGALHGPAIDEAISRGVPLAQVERERYDASGMRDAPYFPPPATSAMPPSEQRHPAAAAPAAADAGPTLVPGGALGRPPEPPPAEYPGTPTEPAEATAATPAAADSGIGAPGAATVSHGPVYATGDSHAWGMIAQGGLQGTVASHHGNPNVDAEVGRSPREEFNYITSRPDGYWRGKNVVLSTGAANDPSQVALVPQQVQALKDRGANVVGISGFTAAGASGTDMHPAAAEIDRYASAQGIPFGGIWSQDIRPGDPVHLTPQGYGKVGAWYNGGIGSPASAGRSAQGAPADTPTSPAGTEAGGSPPAWASRFGPNVSPRIATMADTVVPHGTDDFTRKAELGFKALLPIENNLWNPAKFGVATHIIDPTTGRPERAIGPAQVMPSTGRQYGYTPEQLQDEATNLKAGYTIFSDYLRKSGGDLQRAYAMYYGAADPKYLGPAMANYNKLAGGASLADIAGNPARGGGSSGGIGGGAPDQIAGTGINPGGAGGGIGNAVATVSHNALAAVPPEHQAGMAAWMHSPYYLAFLVGSGMLASRSPFPGVALGQGLLTGAKGMETQAGQDLRERQLSNEATNRNATLGLEQKRLEQTGNYQTGELAVRQQTANQQLQTEDRHFQIQMGTLNRQADRDAEIARHNQAVETINASWRHAAAAKPLPAYQTDENGEMVTGTQTYNDLTGRWEFQPGATVGHAPRMTDEQISLHDLMTSGAAKDKADAIRLLSELKRDPQHNSQTYARMIETEAARLGNKDMTMPEGVIEAQARRHVDARLGAAPGAAAPGAAAPAAPRPAAPASGAPAAPAAAAPPAVARPPNVPDGSAFSPSRNMWRDPQGNLYDRAGHTVSP